jgi:catechol 2,3-dioxygenase-like lactoylglutathione lyase family enzyme
MRFKARGAVLVRLAVELARRGHKELHHDTLYHLGIGVTDKRAVIRAYGLAKTAGVTVQKPPRTTWRGTPLHELWLEDPDGNLVEVYARLTDEELASKPANLEPTALA